MQNPAASRSMSWGTGFPSLVEWVKPTPKVEHHALLHKGERMPYYHVCLKTGLIYGHLGWECVVEAADTA